MIYFWLTVVLVLSVIEMLTVNIVTIWYVVSGIVTIIVSLFVDSFFVQSIIFTIGGTLLLITTRPLLEKVLSSKEVKTNFDRVVGMEGIVTEKIEKNNVGEVKVDGKKWSAISTKEIEKGKTVIILDIDGVKLKVKEI